MTLMCVFFLQGENLLASFSLNIGTRLKQMMSSLNLKQEKKKVFERVLLLHHFFAEEATRRSPLKFSLCRNASSLSPNNIQSSNFWKKSEISYSMKLSSTKRNLLNSILRMRNVYKTSFLASLCRKMISINAFERL